MPARLIAAAEAIVTALVLSAENYLTKVGSRRTLWLGARLKKAASPADDHPAADLIGVVLPNRK
jgi:hypothetical protein